MCSRCTHPIVIHFVCFRFVHDIITATKKSTGFPNRYFTKEELDSAKLKDKDSKVVFLNKFVHLVSICHGSLVDVRPSKIVAGLEPLKTNILLTLFGKIAVDTTFDHDAAIAHCITGGEIGKLPQTINGSSSKLDTDRKAKGKTDSDDAKATDIRTFGARGHHMPHPTELQREIPESESKENGAKDPVEMRNKTDVGDQINKKDLKALIEGCNSDITLTKTVIDSHISKPKCSEKLLGKPPFRFIHDVVMAINKVTNMNLQEIYRSVSNLQ